MEEYFKTHWNENIIKKFSFIIRPKNFKVLKIYTIYHKLKIDITYSFGYKYSYKFLNILLLNHKTYKFSILVVCWIERFK